MFCPNCGQPVKETEKFCQNCGARIEHPQQPEATASAQPEQPKIVPPTYVPPIFTPPADAQPTQQPFNAQATQPAPKKSKKTLWIVLACVAVVLIAAVVALCIWAPWNKTGRSADIKKPTVEIGPEATLRAAFEKLDGVKSMHADMVENVSFEIAMPDLNYTQSMDFQMSVAMDLEYDPARTHSEITLNGMGMSQSALVYGEVTDGGMVSYSSTDGGKTWTATGPIEVAAEQVSFADSMEIALKNIKNLEKTGAELVDGVNVTVYTGTLSGAYMNDMIGFFSSDTADMFSALGIDTEWIKDADDMHIAFYLDDDGNLMRYTLEMTDLMQTVLNRMLKAKLSDSGELNVEYNVKKTIIDCRLSQVNAVPPIVIPAEAKGSAQASNGDGLVGTWELSGGVGEEAQQSVALMLAFGMKMEFTFNADGTGSSYISMGDDVDEESFTYTIEGNQLVVDGEGAEFTLDGDTLTIEMNGEGMIFTRK